MTRYQDAVRLTRRLVLAGAASVFAAAIAMPASAQDDPLAELAKVAATKGPVTWYESSPEEQADGVIAAFNEAYPDVEINFIRVIGGNALASRAVQEVQGQGYTADVVTGGADHIWQLHGRGLLADIDWQSLGLPKALTPTSFAVVTAASVYVVLWNTTKVDDAEVPTTWEGIMDDKWSGRIGHWVRAASFAQLASLWGEDKARGELEKFVQLKPFLFKSTFPLAQQVAAGEVDIAIGFYHTSQPPIQAGAPLKAQALNPTPMHTIYSAVTKDARNPEGAKLLVAWLAGETGAKAYEASTNRGNPLVEGTNTASLLEGKEIVEWGPKDSVKLGEINEAFNKIIATAGEPR